MSILKRASSNIFGLFFHTKSTMLHSRQMQTKGKRKQGCNLNIRQVRSEIKKHLMRNTRMFYNSKGHVTIGNEDIIVTNFYIP